MALLTLDRNGNGVVDNGEELFGTATVLSSGETAGDGFEALADFDGNWDGRVDSSDAVFGSLRLWLDRNHDGASQSAELMTLAEAGITAIFTQYTESPRVDKNGNRYALVGAALILKNKREHARTVFDVFLQVAR